MLTLPVRGFENGAIEGEQTVLNKSRIHTIVGALALPGMSHDLGEAEGQSTASVSVRFVRFRRERDLATRGEVTIGSLGGSIWLGGATPL